jgi:hypothetical protein
LGISGEDRDAAGGAGRPGLADQEVKPVQQVVGLVEHGVAAAADPAARHVLELAAELLDEPDLGDGQRHAWAQAAIDEPGGPVRMVVRDELWPRRCAGSAGLVPNRR